MSVSDQYEHLSTQFNTTDFLSVSLLVSVSGSVVNTPESTIIIVGLLMG